MALSAVLFEDIFEVVKRDPDGKKFDRGEHVSGISTFDDGKVRRRICMQEKS